MEITKKKLEKMYYSMTNEEVCKELGVSQPTLRSYLKEAGIPLKGSGRRKTALKIKG